MSNKHRPHLWDPITLPCGLKLSNRLAKGAMTENLADPSTNSPNSMHVKLYEEWAKSGTGMLITGNVMVDRKYLECPGNVAIENEDFLYTLREWANCCKSHGSALIMQISHPGRQCPISITRSPVAPSTLPPVQAALPIFSSSRGLTVPEIEAIIDRFVNTASVARKSGFDGVQVHSAHGYLLSQFLSPLTNHRTDEYGGSIGNRSRMLRTIIRKIRKKEGSSFAIAVKLNSADFQKGGMTMEESFEVVTMLHQEGVDLIEISGGNYENPALLSSVKKSTRVREAFFMEYVTELRKRFQHMNVPLMLTGGFRTAIGMNEAISSGAVDIIGLARPLCTQSNLVKEFLTPNSLDKKLEFTSPVLHIPLLSKLDPALENLWHQLQITRIATGKSPSLRMGILWCLTFQTIDCYIWCPRRQGVTTTDVLKKCAMLAAIIACISVSGILYQISYDH